MSGAEALLVAVFTVGLGWASALFKIVLDIRRTVYKMAPINEILWKDYQQRKGLTDYDAGQD